MRNAILNQAHASVVPRLGYLPNPRLINLYIDGLHMRVWDSKTCIKRPLKNGQNKYLSHKW